MIWAGNLIHGYSKSCGCLHRERASESNRTHGQTIGVVSPEYQAWLNAKGRCFNPAENSYPSYGGRGITMCAAWRESFEAFLAYIGPRPSPWHSVDRYPNVNGNYEPGNVRWATRSEQARNRRDNRHVVINGQRLTIAEAARAHSLNRWQMYKKSRKAARFTLDGLVVEVVA